MNSLIKTYLMLIVLAASVLSADTVSGTVTDSVYGYAVAGVKVKCTAPVCSTYTDSAGKFSLTFPTTGVVVKNSVRRNLVAKFPMNVQNVQGITVARISSAEDFRNLPAGIYVVAGQKIMNLKNRNNFLSTEEVVLQSSSMAKAIATVINHSLVFAKSGYKDGTLSVSGTQSVTKKIIGVSTGVFLITRDRVGKISGSVGGLQKTIAGVNDSATYVLIMMGGVVKDSCRITGDTTKLVCPGLIKGKRYNAIFSAYSIRSSGSYQFNANKGTYADNLDSFTVPMMDTFFLKSNLMAMAGKIDVKIPIKGTKVEMFACSTFVCWKQINTSGTPDQGYWKISFNPGSVDTTEFVWCIGTGGWSNPSSTYQLLTEVYCSNGDYFNSVDTLNISRSVNYSVQVSLTKH
jgi:hypothetical protein